MKRKMENVEVYEMLCGLYNMIENSHDAICDGPNPADRSRLYPLMPIVVGLREEYREKSLEDGVEFWKVHDMGETAEPQLIPRPLTPLKELLEAWGIEDED